MSRQPEDRGLVARAHPEHTGVVAERAVFVQRPCGHRHLPVLPVLPALWEAAVAEVISVRLEDLPDQAAELRILEVLQLAELAVRKRLAQTPSWLKRVTFPASWSSSAATSASTISPTSSLKRTFGSHPSFSLALVASPSSTSTSEGR